MKLIPQDIVSYQQQFQKFFWCITTFVLSYSICRIMVCWSISPDYGSVSIILDFHGAFLKHGLDVEFWKFLFYCKNLNTRSAMKTNFVLFLTLYDLQFVPLHKHIISPWKINNLKTGGGVYIIGKMWGLNGKRMNPWLNVETKP